jgi:asparagine synthase (glutamine-hydrolysing)
VSGLFGIVGPADRAEIEAMGGRMAHKGRHCRVWSPAPNVWFGEVRNSPRPDDADDRVAFSGQLYLDWQRSPDRPAGLPDAMGRDQAQRRLVANGVINDPEGFMHRLDGHFGVAYWDDRRSELRLTTDRINYENIFFTEAGGRFVFASEYKALLALEDVRAAPDPDALQYSMATMLPNYGGSLCAAISRVAYGYTLIVGRRGKRLERYFKPNCVAADGSLEHFAAGLRELLVDRVRTLFAHHNRIAITLGGGLDSASLLGLIRCVFPDRTIASYSIGSGPNDPELVGARIAAEHFDTEHHEFVFDPATLVEDLPRLVWLTEEYASREESLLQYQVECRIVGRERLLTGGHGSDMILAGMPRHRLIRLGELAPFARRGLTEVYQQTQSGLPPTSLVGRLGSALLFRGNAVPPPQIAGSSGPSRVHEPTSICDMLNDLIGGFHPFHYHSAIYALQPIEVVMPFMTKAVMEYAMRIPTRYKVGVFDQKMVLRTALQTLLPDAIRKRRKAIQRAKNSTALSDALDTLAAQLLSRDDVVTRGLVDPSYVERIRRRPASGIYGRNQLTRLWMLICGELWCRAFVDHRGVPSGFTLRELYSSVPDPVTSASTIAAESGSS